MNANGNADAKTKVKGFPGKFIRLAAVEPDKFSETMARWALNSEYQQLSDSGPARLYAPANIKEWLEKHADELFSFTIHTLEDDRMIGEVDLGGLDWIAGNCWVGIGIGEPEYWGKGYGSDAMNQILRFGFEQLNLRRVSLTVFEYNERAYRSYLKCGFKEEGRQRQWIQRSGERFDMIFMGILREEWLACQAAAEKHMVSP